MKKSVKALIIIAIIVAFCCISVTALSIIPSNDKQYGSILEEWTDKLKPSNVGKDLKEKLDNNTDKVIAYINGEAIYQNEFDVSKYLNELSYYNATLSGYESQNTVSSIVKLKTDDEILKEIALNKLMYKEAEKLGIACSKEEAIKRLKESRNRAEKEAKAGSKLFIDNLKKDDEFFNAMGITSDEYIQSIGSQMEMETQTNFAFVKYFFKEEQKKKQSDPNYVVRDYYNYLDELLENADFQIVK